jgi:hypothetical protein
LRVFLILFPLLLAPPNFGISAQETGRRSALAEKWYISNAGGMALEPASSRLAALRNKYGLMVGRASSGELPELLREYYQVPWAIEVRVLYTEGAESRRQWIFLDLEQVIRVVAVFVKPPAPDEGDTEEGGIDKRSGLTGFIELYDPGGLLSGERRFYDDGEETGAKYFYNRRILIRAETTRKPPPDLGTGDSPGGEDAGDAGQPVTESAAGPGEAVALEGAVAPEEAEAPPPAAPADSGPDASLPVERLVSTDYYRYSRSGSLRAIERVYHEPPEKIRLRFPHRILDSVSEQEFVNPSLAYGSEFLTDIFMDSVHRVVYNTDHRGRVLSETRMDSNGRIVGELSNLWAEDRLTQVTWKAGEDERRIEYGYNADGDRIEERNYRKEDLERVVRKEGDIEVEELYMNGQPVLRARWEKGRKISEERIRLPPGRTR